MRILMTGGAGFIGSHIVDAYIAHGHKVAVVDDLSTGKKSNINPEARFYRIDIQDPELKHVFEGEKPDCVNHHAAQMSVALSVKDPLLDAKINVLGLVNLLENCVQSGVRKVIFASSGGCVYGEAETLPIGEEAPLQAISPYAVTKIAGEHYLHYYHKQYGLDYTVLRYSNVYGPRQDPYGEAGVVAIFSKAMLAGERPTINAAKTVGDEGCVRDFVYVADVTEANLAALGRGGGEIFNIGSGVGTTVYDLYRKIARETGFGGEARYGPPRPGDLLRNVLSCKKAKAMLGWEPSFSLEEGLRETVEYFRRLKG